MASHSQGRAPKRKRTRTTKTGRKSRLEKEPDLADRIVARVEHGTPLTVCAQAEGVPKSTFMDWMAWGEAGEQPYSDFSDRVREAEARTHDRLFHAVASDPDWRAQQAAMKMRYQDHYNETQKVEISGPEGAPIAITPALGNIPDQDLQAEIRVLEAEIEESA